MRTGLGKPRKAFPCIESQTKKNSDLMSEIPPTRKTLTSVDERGAFQKEKGSPAPPCSTDKLPKEQDEMARDIACFLWGNSDIRNGMFTPPEFIPMASSIIREYFKQQNEKGQ